MARKSDIRLRRSNVANAVPGGADLNEGELAINTADGALYFKKSDGTIITGHDNTIMHIDSADSRVGIGNVNPGKELDVLGTVRAKDSSANQHQLRADKIISYGTDAILQAQSTGDDVRLNTTGNVTRLIATAEGNVGIGTDSPSSALHVSAGDGSAELTVARTGTYASSWSLKPYNADFYIRESGTDRVTIKAGGSVGIGTTSPSAALHISGTSAGQIRLERTNHDTFRIGLQSAVGLGFHNVTDNRTDMIIAGDGKVGIGTTSPSEKLDVRDGTITSRDATNTNYAELDRFAGLILKGNGASAKYITTPNTDDLGFKTNNIERARIDSSGNLLVGKTSDTYSNQGITFRGSPATGASGATFTRDGNNVAAFNRLNSDGSIVTFAKDSTTVGSIGTKSDDVYIVTGDTGIRFNDGNDQIWPVNVSGASRDGAIDLGNSGVRFKDLHLSGNAYIGSSAYAQYFGNASDTNTLIQFAGSDDIRFRVGGTETIRINTNGVGIGTSSPQANMALDVRSDASTAGSTGIASYGYNGSGRAILGNGYATSGTGTNKGIEGISTGPRSSVSGSVNVGGHFYATGAENNYALTTGAGNVGINTSSPAKQLHIHQPSGETGFLLSRNNGLTSTNIQLSVDSTKTRFISYGDLTFMTATTGSGTNASERMRISTDGKVGIGTNSPGHKLHVVGANNTTPFSIDIGAAASYNFKANSNSTYSTTFNMDADGLTIGHDSAYREVALQTAGTNRLVIAPAGAITFNNAFTFPTSIGSAGQVLKVPNSGSVLVWSDQTGGGGSTDSISDADGDTKIQVEESADEDIIRFDIAGTEQLQLNSTGLVVAGNLTVNGTQTILNTATLSVDDLNITVADGAANAAAANGAGLTVDGANATLTYTAAEDRWNFNKKLYVPDNIRIAAPGPQLILQDTTDDDDHAIRFMDNGGTNRMSITTLGDDLRFETTGGRNFVFMGDTTNYGNVGIGTTAPTTALEVIGDIKIKQQSGYSNYSLIDASEALLTLETYSVNTSSYSADIIFKPAGTERMRIGDDGNVGIGTSSPTDKLTVSQSADANGIRINGYDDRSDCFAEMHISPAGNTVIRQVNADSSGYLQIQAQNYLELSGPSLVYTSSNFRIYDAGSLQIGTHNDLELSHDGTNNLIKNINGNLYIRNDADDGDIVLQSDDGSGGLAEYLKIDGGDTQIKVSKTLKLYDDVQAWLGNSNDLRIYHNGTTSNSNIENHTGGLFVTNYQDDGNIVFRSDNGSGGVAEYIVIDGGTGSTILKSYGAEKAKTQSWGLLVTGTLNADALHIGQGSSDLISVHNDGTFTSTYRNNTGGVLDRRYADHGNNGTTVEYQTRVGMDGDFSSTGNFSAHDFRLRTNNLDRMTVDGAGNIGIGLTNPSSLLHIYEDATSLNNTTTDLLKLEGNIVDFGTTPAAIALAFKFQDGNNNTNEARIRMATVNDTDYGDNDEAASNLIFSTTNGGTEADKMIITGRGEIGIGTTNPKAKLQVEEYGIDTTTSSTTATTQVAIHTFPIANFRSARFTIQITNTTDSTYHSTEILAIHDGTTANITEFGEVHTGSSVEATFDADISGGNFRLLATPASTNSMTFKVVCHSLTV